MTRDPIYNRRHLGNLMADVDAALTELAAFRRDVSELERSSRRDLWRLVEVLEAMADNAARAARVATEIAKRDPPRR